MKNSNLGVFPVDVPVLSAFVVGHVFFLWHYTGKSLSEALILASTNLQYDDRLFMDLPVQYIKTKSSDHGKNMGRTCCVHVLSMFS